ncbi:MAG TPA: NlpC/P60 family protein [Bryobacteraceae bacterium]|nr:NlpC/P60 family protein [Bryobacteraceae bacterium]
MVLLMAALLVAADAVVVTPVANMYSRPTEDTDVVSQAIHGTTVAVLEQKDGFSKIRTPDDYTGWIAGAAIRSYAAGEKPYASEAAAQVEQLFANLYREPDVTKHQPVITLPYEARLELLSMPAGAERWLQARLADGRIAWIQKGDLGFQPARAGIPDTIDFSKRFLGLPYLWGGTSSFGYDCSGFTQMLCRRRGVNMPRDAGPQARWDGVAPVASKQDLKAGDLLYFGSSEKKITHTGMYIGSGEFIHASTHERPVVQIGKLDDPYWTKLLVAMRRVK